MTIAQLYSPLAAGAEVLTAVLCLLTLPAVLYCLALLFAAAAHSRRTGPPIGIAPSRLARFCILIPAHDEALLISKTLARLRSLDYPADNVRVVVVADNCADDTAALAAEAGAQVLVRVDSARRGKGYALNWALSQLLPERDFDVVAIVDADTMVHPDFLTHMNRTIESAESADRPRFAAQGQYRVLKADDGGWRTALMSGALSLVHHVRPLARERWRTSAGLKGNGMCFGAELLEQNPWPGDSLTEDLDYGLDLIETGGVRVRYVPHAVVEAQMPDDASSAAGQRRRWEAGRFATVRRRALPLLIRGLARRDRLRVDAALDLLCPPLAQIGAGLALWACVVAFAYAVHAPGAAVWAALWMASVVGLAVYVLAGFKLGGAPRAAYRALAMAAVFVPWKIVTLMRGRRNVDWKRTDRTDIEPESDGPRIAVAGNKST